MNFVQVAFTKGRGIFFFKQQNRVLDILNSSPNMGQEAAERWPGGRGDRRALGGVGGSPFSGTRPGHLGGSDFCKGYGCVCVTLDLVTGKAGSKRTIPVTHTPSTFEK